MPDAGSNLFVVRIAALRNSESQERVALYLSGRLRGKTVEEIRGYLDHLPIVVTRRAGADLAERIQRELSDLGAVVELEPIGAETAPPTPAGPPPISASLPGPVSAFFAAPPPAPAAGLPWDQRRQIGFFKAWWDTFYMSVRWPREFCARVPARGGYLEPLYYAVLSTMIGALGAIVWQIPLQLMPLALSQGIMGKIGAGLGMLIIGVGVAAALIFLPIFFAVFEFIWAGVAHCFVFLVGGRGGFEATFRVNCFANSCQVFQVVPLLGGMISLGYWCVLVYYGYRQAHRLEPAPAVVAMILPVALMILMVVGIVIAVVFAVLGSLGSFDLNKFIPE